MAQPSNEEIVRRYIGALATHDGDTLGSGRNADWTMEFPQSGERIRGHANDRAIIDHWPDGRPTGEGFQVFGSEDRWVVTPFNTVQRIVGSGDFWWADGTARYPDGSSWFLAVQLQLKGGKVHRERWFFAPPFDAPAWRAAWVERMT